MHFLLRCSWIYLFIIKFLGCRDFLSLIHFFFHRAHRFHILTCSFQCEQITAATKKNKQTSKPTKTDRAQIFLSLSHKNQGQYFVPQNRFTLIESHSLPKQTRIPVNYPRNIIAILSFCFHTPMDNCDLFLFGLFFRALALSLSISYLEMFGPSNTQKQTVRQPRTLRLHLFLMVKTDQLTKTTIYWSR